VSLAVTVLASNSHVRARMAMPPPFLPSTGAVKVAARLCRIELRNVDLRCRAAGSRVQLAFKLRACRYLKLLYMGCHAYITR